MKKLPLLLAFILFVNVFANAGAAFQVQVVGKGKPILFFPGFGCTGDVFKEAVAKLSKQYECHVFTFAGFGNVPAIEKPWLPKIKDEVIAYVHNRQLKQAVIVGHSLGGTLGLWLASSEKQLFKKVIAVDALPCTGALMVPNFKVEDMVYESPYSKQMMQMDAVAFRAMASQQVNYMILNKQKHAQVLDWMLMADRSTFVYGYVDLLRLDLREDIAAIQIPVVVLAATHPNKTMIEKTYNEQFAKLQQKTILYADQSAHFVMYDQPEWFLTQLTENVQ